MKQSFTIIAAAASAYCDVAFVVSKRSEETLHQFRWLLQVGGHYREILAS